MHSTSEFGQCEGRSGHISISKPIASHSKRVGDLRLLRQIAPRPHRDPFPAMASPSLSDNQFNIL